MLRCPSMTSPPSPPDRSIGSGRAASFATMLIFFGASAALQACGSSSGPATTPGSGGTTVTPDGGASGTGGAAGDTDAAPADAPAGPTLADFVSAFCAAARACCAAAPGATELLANCETTLPSTSPRYAAVVAGTVVPNPEVFPGCVAALEQAGTTCSVPPQCQNLWLGTKSEGGSCTLFQECRDDQGAVICFRAADPSMPPAFTGVCRPAVRGAAGDACIASCGPGLDCSEGLYAQASSPIGICHTEDGLYCESGVCTPLHAPGTPCTVDPECGTEGYCATTCTPRKTAGQPCLHDDECSQQAHLFCVDDVCAPPPLATDLVCMGDLFQ